MTESRKDAGWTSETLLAHITEQFACMQQLMKETDHRIEQRFEFHEKEIESRLDRIQERQDEFIKRLETVESFQATRKGELARERIDTNRTMWLIGLIGTLIVSAATIVGDYFFHKSQK